MRFEKLITGIQAFEKIRILKETFTKNNNNAGLKKIEDILNAFDENLLEQTPANVFTEKAMQEVNKL